MSTPALSDPFPILNVDDNDAIRYARTKTLTNAGYRVIEASTGEEALLLAVSHRPRLLVLDINLPTMSGLEVCRRLKENRDTAHIMVLQVSSERSSTLDVVVGLEGGADSYLIEPIEPLELVATVRALVRSASRQEDNLRLAAIVDSSQDAIVGKDLTGTVLSWNRGAEELFGYTAAEMIGAPVLKLIPPDRRHEEEMILARIARGERVGSYETVRMKKDGGRVHISLTVSPVRDAAGRVVGASKIARDITQRILSEQALIQSEERFRQVFQHAATGMAITDWEGRFQQCNPAYHRLLGYSEEDLRDRDSVSLLHPDDRADYRRELCRLTARSARSFEVELRCLHKDGRVVWVHHFVSTLGDPAGGPSHLVALVTDVTDRRHAEERERRAAADARAAALANAKFRTFFDQGSYFAGVMALDGTILEANRLCLDACGFSREDVVGKKFWDCGWWNRSPALMEMVRQGTHEAADGRFFRRESGYYLADGSERKVDLMIAPVKDETGRIIFLAPSGTDITERKAQEAELRRLKDQLEQHVAERTQELVVSQDRLRSLSSQLAMAEQRQRQKLAQDLHDYLAQMLAVGHMRTGMAKKQPELSAASRDLINELAKIFQQALTYTRTLIAELNPPSFEEVGLAAALKFLGDRMQNEGLKVEVLANPEPVPLSEEQAVLVFQSVRELLFNVLKHAGIDRAAVSVQKDGGAVRVTVQDHGKGMSEDDSRRAAEPGHLGLFAVRERMESMGGRMDVASTLGKGTVVTLSLPLPPTQSARQYRQTA